MPSIKSRRRSSGRWRATERTQVRPRPTMKCGVNPSPARGATGHAGRHRMARSVALRRSVCGWGVRPALRGQRGHLMTDMQGAAPMRMQCVPKRGARRRKASGEPPAELVERLEGLLPREALEDALDGLDAEQITGPGGLLAQLAGRVIETALGAELGEHLGHPPGGVPAGANVRNGSGRKTVQTDLGA